jgi:hypothetical protein
MTIGSLVCKLASCSHQADAMQAEAVISYARNTGVHIKGGDLIFSFSKSQEIKRSEPNVSHNDGSGQGEYFSPILGLLDFVG